MSETVEVDSKLQKSPDVKETREYNPLFTRPKTRRRRPVWPIVTAIILLVVLFVGGFIAYRRFFSTPRVRYTQQAVTTGDITVTASATGPVKPKAEYDMNFTTSGQVNAINVHVGQQVKAGQTLATLSSSTLQDALTSAQHRLDAAKAAYNDATSSGAAQSVLDQDNANVTSAQDAVQAAQDALNAATLKAPADGTVAAINGTVGQNVGAGSGSSTSSSSSSGSQAFITLIDTSTLTLNAQVNEADITQLQSGQTAQFTVSAYPTRIFRATVSDVGTVGQTSSNVVNYPVILTVDANSLRGAHLYPGMTATINITTAQHTGVLEVPSTALSFPTQALRMGEVDSSTLRSAYGNRAGGQGSQGNGRGIVLELQNGKLVPVAVTTGLSNGQYTEILSGLSEGDRVVVGQTGGNTTTQNTSSGGGIFGGGLRNGSNGGGNSGSGGNGSGRGRGGN